MGKRVFEETPVVSIADTKQLAKLNMERKAWLYLEQGAAKEQTLRDNLIAFQRYRLMPYMLRGLQNISTATSLLGQRVTSPIHIAPTASQAWAHPDGEKATARAAAAKGVINVLSAKSSYSMEDVAAAAPSGVHWQQTYPYKDRDVGLDLIRRAERLGFKAIVVTLDHHHGQGMRYTAVKYNIKLPSGLRKYGNFPEIRPVPAKYKGNNPRQAWEDLAWIRNMTSLPVIVKGILRSEDAVKALEHGANAIWISNHGGRNLDSTPSALDVLQEIVEKVDGRAEVYMDGGIRTGTDVAMAIALGARAVFIGRPVWYGLAYNGQEGVEKVLEILQQELYSTMLLIGVDTPGKLDSSFIRKISST